MKICSRKHAIRRLSRTHVYADLGDRDGWSMPVKAQLVSRISELLTERRMSQTKAATVLGIPQPKLSMILHGQFRQVSLFKLMQCFTRLGYDVYISFRKRQNRSGAGRVSVSFE